MRIYTYGIIDSNANIVEPIGGLEGACAYNLPYRNIGAVASKLINQIKEINRDDVLKHEEVVERLMENFTVLPVRFFTTFNQEEEVLVMLKEYYQDFKENLDRLRNKVEFGIRVIWPSETIRNRIVEASKKFNAFATKSPQNIGDPPKHYGGNGESANFATKNGESAKQCGGNFGGDVTIPDNSPGKSFAKEKFENYKIDKEFAEEADRCIAFLDDFFSRFSAEKKLEKLKSDNLLLNAYYLVEKEKQGDFKEAFERAKNTPGDLKYLFSGPWPPYNFINLNKKPYCFKDFEGIDILEKETSNQDLSSKETI